MLHSFYYLFSVLLSYMATPFTPCHHTFEITEANDAEKIYWSPDAQLTWADFEAEPDYSKRAVAALTASAIVYRYHCGEDGYLVYNVQAAFKKDQSWVKEEALTAHHLQHEQLHFDITELYARQLRKNLANFRFKCDQVDDFEHKITLVLQSWQAMERKYDIETKFSLDREMQQEWKIFVREHLDNFHEYALTE